MTTKKILFGSTLLAAAALNFCAASANAATLTWAGTDDNSSWNYTDTNWSNGSTFSSGDNAIFDDSAESSEVYIEDEITAGTITISSGSYIFTLSDDVSLSATSLTINEGTSLEITGAGTFIGSSPSSSATIDGNLTISAGETTFGGSPTYSSFVYIGYNSGSSGSLMISGGDATFSVRVHIGQNSGASGSLTIGSVDGTGGTTKFEDSVYVGYNGTGELTIFGGETTFGANVSVGDSGTGKLTITGGETIFSGSYVFIGNNSGSSGTMEITGGTTKFENEVRVGDSGTGKLTITGGDVTFSSQVLLGRESGSSGTLTIGSDDGTGGNTKFSNTVYVGRSGTGKLTIFGGETTFSSTVYLGQNSGSSGTMEISGGKTTFSTVYLGYNSDSSGTMEITGGETNFVGAVSVGNSGTGSLTISGGDTTFSSSVTVANGSSLSLTGGTITLSSEISNSGTVTVNNDVVFVLDEQTPQIVEGTLYISLISGSGSITGWESLTTSNFSLNGKIVSGRSTIDVTTAGQVIITYVEAADLVWNGTTGNNVWTETITETNKIWLNDGTNSDHFYSYDNVTFGANGEKSVSIASAIEAGTITVTGSGYTFDFSDDSSVTADSLTIKSAGSLEIANGTTTFGSIEIEGGLLTVSGGDVTVSGSASVTTGGSISLTNGTLTLQGTLSLDDNTLSVSGGKLVVDGATISGLSFSKVVSGEISVVNNGSLSLSDTTIASTGSITVGENANLSLDGTIDLSSAISNSGTVTVSDSVVFALDNLTNEDGTYTIVSGGTIEGWGDLTKSNFSLNGKGLGRSTIDVRTAGQVTITVVTADLIWNGTSTDNVWTNNGEEIWLNNGTQDVFIEYDNVTFGSEGEKSVSIVGTIEAGTITVTGSGYTFDFSGDSSVTADSLTIAEGGSLEISGTGSLAISNSATVDGALKITGGETTFEYRVYVGYDGTGTMEIGSVDGTGGETTFEHRVYVGYDGTGTLTISSGETTFSRDVYLGYNSTSSGTLTIGSADGIGGETKFGSIVYVGYNGTGKLTITGGETTFSSYVYLGYFSGSSGTMEIGSVDGTGGETTFSSYVYLGYYSGSSGTLTISGGETSFGGTVYVGSSGTGELTISGGETTFSSSVYLGYNSGASGTMEISGGTTKFNGIVYVGSSGTGTLTISGGETTFSSSVTVAAGSSLSLTGGTITLSEAISNSGTVTVGDSVVFVLDNLTNEDGTYTLISGGTINGWSTLDESNFSLNSKGLGRSTVDVTTTDGQVTITYVAAENLVWNGTDESNVWTNNGDEIWTNSDTSDADMFYSYDNVTFGSDGEKSVTIIGKIEAGTITVTGSGYTFTFSDDSSVTADSLTIESAGSLEIANGTTTFGSIEIDEGGSLTVSGGDVTVSGSASVTTGGSISLTNGTLTLQGTLSLDDSTLSVSGGKLVVDGTTISGLSLSEAVGGEISVVNNGSLSLSDTTITSTGSITVGENANLSLDGTIDLSSAISNSGTVTVSDSVVFALDNLTNEDGTYTIVSGGAIEGWSTLTGSNFSISGAGHLAVEITTSGQVTITATGVVADLVWNGTTDSNIWTNDGDKIWLNGGSGDYFYSYDNVTFGSDGEKTVSIVGAIEAGTITVTGSGYTFKFSEDSSLTADSLTITGEDASLEITGTGTFTTSSSSTIDGSLTIGSVDATDNITTTFGDTVYVGYSSTTGSLTITGEETIFKGWVEIGYKSGSSGSLTITGGTTTFNGREEIGYESSSSGSLTIYDGETNFNGDVYVGYSGTGSLTISGGETTFSSYVDLGRYSGSSGTLTITDGKTTFKGDVRVGENGTGKLTITGGETTFSNTVHIGCQKSSSGSLTIGSVDSAGGETTTFSGDVYIGDYGEGELTIYGGTTKFGSTVRVGYRSGSSGTLTIGSADGTDGETTFSGNVYLGYESDSSGSLTITGGKTTFGANVSVGNSGRGELKISGGETTLNGVAIGTDGSLAISGGTVSVTGSLTSTGSITVGTGASLSLDGTIDLSFAIANSGTVTLGDSVVFVLNDALTTDGTTYTFITGGTITSWGSLTYENFSLNGDTLSHGHTTLNVSVEGQVTLTTVVADLVWNGDENNSTWTTDTSDKDWKASDGYADYFANGDSVTFGATADSKSKSVTISGTITANAVTVTGSGYTFSFYDGDSSLTANTLTINSGASLEITGEESGSFTVSSTATIDGSLTIGENVTTTFGSTVYVGYSGNGSLTIGSVGGTGGETTFKSSVTVAAESSLSLTGGTITLSSAISNSGTVTVNKDVVFALDNLATGDNTYTVISNQSDGSIEGWSDLTKSNFRLNGKGLGRSTVDVETAGQVTITFVAAANLVWSGTTDSNVWTNNGENIWLNNESPDAFVEYDNVTFGADGEKSVSIVGAIEAGTITVTGSGYTFDFSGDSSLSATSLTINSGASLEITGTGSFTTSSSASTIDGSLTIGSVDGTDNVTTTFGGAVYVSYYNDRTGTLAISGGTTTFEDEVYVGYNDSLGSITISDGETKFSNLVRLGYYSGSSGTLTISGGTTTFENEVRVGISGTGELTITGGETTFKNDVYVGYNYGSSGSLTITGGEATFSGAVRVGSSGTGSLTISGGTTTFKDLVEIGYYDGSSGSLTISGGTTTFEKEVYVGYNGTGELTISGGETTFKSSVTVAAESSLSLTGGTITLSSAISNSGTVTVGENVVFVLDSLGSGGTYTIISGTGEIEGWDTLDESNFSLNGKGLGRSTVNVTTAGQVTITYVAAANLVWNGTASSNVWTNDGKEIWLNGKEQDVFIEYDNVTFGSDGEKSVTIIGAIEAGTVTVTGSGYTFTFSEDSSLTADHLTIDRASLEITNGETTITTYVEVFAESTLKISGGTLTADRLSIYDRSSLEITNGETTITTYVDVFDESTLKISGGTLTADRLTIEARSSLEITNGETTITYADVFENSTLKISGGTTTADSISIEMESSIELTGGELTVKTLYLHHGSGSFSGGILNVGWIASSSDCSLSFGDGLTVNLYDTTSLTIDSAITLSGTVTFNAKEDETIELRGDLSGSGKLVKDGEGTLTLYSDNTYSGGTTISSGTVVAMSENALGTGAVAIDDGATLEIPTSREFTNATSGNGTLSITNNATVSFGSNVGVKNVNVASGATLSSGATLTSSGATLDLAGTLVLDASAGEQVSFTNGGTVILEDSATLNLSGISAVSPTGVKPLAADTEEIGPGSSITIFSGATIEGDIEAFLKTDSTLSALSNDYAVVYDPDKGLTVTILESGNASSLTSGLKLHDGIGSDFISAIIRDEDLNFDTGLIDADDLSNPIVRALATGNISEASKMFDTLAPNDYAAMVAMPTTSFYNDVKAIDNRLAARRGPLDENARWEFFAQAQGTFVENDDARDTQTFDFDLYGVLAGADYRVNEGLTVGVTVGYDYGKADIHNSGGKIESDDVRVTLFAGQQIGEMFFVNAGAQVGYGHYEAKRKTALGHANGDTDGWNAGVFADVGMMLTLSEELKIAARPYVGLAYIHSEVGSFDDNIFDVDDFHGDSLRASIGCGLFWGFDLAEAAWTVGLDASYSHDFCGDEVDIDATCMSTDKDFGITAKALSKDIFSVGPTVSVGLTKSIDIFAGYAFQAGTDSSTGHNVNAGLKVTF